MPAKKRKKPAARKRAKRPAKKAKKPARRKPRAKKRGHVRLKDVGVSVTEKLEPTGGVSPGRVVADPINEDRRSPIWRVLQWMFPF